MAPARRHDPPRWGRAGPTAPGFELRYEKTSFEVVTPTFLVPLPVFSALRELPHPDTAACVCTPRLARERETGVRVA